jgi:hypothetical protein
MPSSCSPSVVHTDDVNVPLSSGRLNTGFDVHAWTHFATVPNPPLCCARREQHATESDLLYGDNTEPAICSGVATNVPI